MTADPRKPLNGTDQPTPTDMKKPLAKALAAMQAREAREASSPRMTQEEFLERQRQRDAHIAFASLSNDLGPRYAPDRASLDTFKVFHAKQTPVIERLKRIAANLREFVQSGRGLVFFGAVGTGKDHLLAAMLYATAREGISCRWVNGQEAYGDMRDRIDKGLEEDEFFRSLCQPQVLALSDPIPPVGQPSAWNIAQLYRLLDRRYRLLKPTWVSLNATSDKDADAKLSAPVFDRLREGAEMLPCFWPSFRQAAS